MKCEMFSRGISAFRSRPILYQMLIEKHLKENSNCVCKLKSEDSKVD